jgi:hypothetical protein
MNPDRYVTSDKFFDYINPQELIEQFQAVVTEIDSGLANALARAKGIVRLLNDQGRKKEAEALAKAIQIISKQTQNIAETAHLLRKTTLFRTAAGRGGQTAA